MIDKLDEGEFKKLLQRHEKTIDRNRENVEILRMVVNVMSDLLRQLVVDSPNFRDYLEEMERVREYANSAFGAVGNRYNNRSIHITVTWGVRKI